MKCRFCVDILLRKANQNPDPAQGLADLKVAIANLPDAITAALQGTPYCLYHYVKGTEIFSSRIQRLLEAEFTNA